MQNVNEIREALEKAGDIVIFSHRSPDGDTIGGNLALRTLLEMRGKRVSSVCADPLPHVYASMPGYDSFAQEWNRSKVDIYINVDGSSTTQLVYPEKDPTIIDGHVPFINIDHHVSNTSFGTINLVRPEACSTTFVLYELFCAFGWGITPMMATYLLLGIYYDTGSLMHSNTSADVMRVCAELMRLGADRNLVMNVLYRTRTPEQLRVWGCVLERVSQHSDGVVISGVTDDDLHAYGASSDEVGGAVDYLNSVSGATFAVLLSHDRRKGVVKGSTRTRRDDIDLAAFCKQLGGGGHRQASGFGVGGTLKKRENISIIGENGERFTF